VIFWSKIYLYAVRVLVVSWVILSFLLV
jgi:hypothetical protein